MNKEGLFLVVARGRNAAAKIRVDVTERIIGRARDAELVLDDPRVSRRHLRVRSADGGARLVVCDGATPFLRDGTSHTEATIAVGETIVVGNRCLRNWPPAWSDERRGHEHRSHIEQRQPNHHA